MHKNEVIMGDMSRKIPAIIKKLEGAVTALEELICLTWEQDYHIPANDTRQKLRTDLLEYLEYLENATWWRKT